MLLMLAQRTVKKIVFITYNYYPPSYSGKLVISGRRFQDIDANSFEVVVFTSGIKGAGRKEKLGKVTLYRSPYIGKGKISKRLNVLLFCVWSSIKLIFEKNVSILHFDEIAGFSVPLLPGFAHKMGWKHFEALASIARVKKIKTVFEHAISDDGGHFAPDKWRKKFLDRVDYLVGVSDALYQAIKQVCPRKAVQITYGIQDDLFVPLPRQEKEQFRRAQGVRNSDVVFCFVGLVVHRKGFDLISEVFPEIVHEFPNSVFWCAGPKSHNESKHIHDDEVEGYIHSLSDVSERVKFWGNIADRQYLAKIIGAADVLLFPTRKEGFGLAPVEAMSCGVPPIIARIPGVTDLACIHGESGIYITPENREELKQAMRLLASDKELRERMGKKARERVAQTFSWRQHVEKWEHLYNGNLALLQE